MPGRMFVLALSVAAIALASSVACGSRLNLDKPRTTQEEPASLPGQIVTTTNLISASVTLVPVPPTPPLSVITTGVPSDEQDAASRVIPILKPALPRGPRKPEPTKLIIASIGLDAKVIPLGTKYNDSGHLVWDTAPFAVGHHLGTANPGEVGNVVLSGHISSLREGAVFKRLPEINVGDGVVVITADRYYLYQVTEKKVVDPSQIDVMNSAGTKVLTMITCVPDGIYSHRLVVTAKQI